jgi:hypothetical protein
MSKPTETIPTMMFSVIEILPALNFPERVDVKDADREKCDRHADIKKIHHEWLQQLKS